MGKLKLTITLNDDKVVLRPGEMVSGQVVMDAQESIDYKAIEVCFKGKARVRWSEGSGENRRTYSAKEKYFKDNVVLSGEGSSAVTTSNRLPAGQSVFPFQYQLPLQIPSSFETVHGYVRYTIFATVRRSGIFSNFSSQCVYTVIQDHDLNILANARSPMGAELSKTLCCCCCASDPIEGKVNTDRTGYVPGEFILINANIDNRSSSDVDEINAKIKQKITLHATSKSRSERYYHATLKLSGCKSRSTVQYNNEKIHVPPLPPSDLTYCSIIDVEYFLQVDVSIPGCHKNLHVNSPITLGTIPLEGITPYNAPPPTQPITTQITPNIVAMNVIQPTPTAPPPTYQAPPPTYAASTAYSVKKSGNTETSGPDTFAPQYAYYDWSQSAFSYN